MTRLKTWSLVALFALAMAWVESAAVYYLRTLVGRINPYQPDPLPIIGGLGQAELVRELATLVMLFTVGTLAGRSWRGRVGYFLVAFGIWDIAYYCFLKLMADWPNSLQDWDLLFLLPLPWWGPVLAPMLIALLMVGGGTLLSLFDERQELLWPRHSCVALNLLGASLALYVFMADTIGAVPGGIETIRRALPTHFNWPLYLTALTLMLAPILDLILQIRRRVSTDSSFRIFD